MLPCKGTLNKQVEKCRGECEKVKIKYDFSEPDIETSALAMNLSSIKNRTITAAKEFGEKIINKIPGMNKHFGKASASGQNVTGVGKSKGNASMEIPSVKKHTEKVSGRHAINNKSKGNVSKDLPKERHSIGKPAKGPSMDDDDNGDYDKNDDHEEDGDYEEADDYEEDDDEDDDIWKEKTGDPFSWDEPESSKPSNKNGNIQPYLLTFKLSPP